MEKTSTIKSCAFTKEYKGDNGTVYYHNLTLDNGDTGSIGAKEQNPAKLAVGQELTYTIEATERGNKIKAVNKPKFGGGGRPAEPIELKMATFSLSYSKDLAVAGTIKPEQMFATADKMYDWINSKLK
jgi:hypothetical protein